MEKILAKLSPRPQLSCAKASVNQDILTKLSEQQVLLEKQKKLLVGNNAVPGAHAEVDETSSASLPPSTTESLIMADGSQCDAKNIEMSEVLRLKQELLAANSKIALQEQELAQTRVIKHTLDQALGPPSEADFGGREITEQTISHLQNAFNASNRSFNQFQDSWNGQEDAQSDISDALSAGAYNSARGFWVPSAQPVFGMNVNAPVTDKTYCEPFPSASSSAGQEPSRFWTGSSPNAGSPSRSSLHPNRVLPGTSPGPCNVDTRLSGEQARFLQGPGLGPRRAVAQVNRAGSCFPTQNSPWGMFAAGPAGNPVPRSPANRQYGPYQQFGMYPVLPYHPRPVGTPLSPTATEFTSTNSSVASWGNSSVSVCCKCVRMNYTHIPRPVETPSKRTCHHLSHLTTADFWTKTFHVTGNILWIRLFATMTNRPPFFYNRSSKLEQLSRNTILLRQL